MTAGAPVVPSRRVTLALVRHGESTWVAEGRFQGRLDPPLSPLGERQATLVASRLAAERRAAPLPLPDGPPVVIRHSPLTRAATTAERIADAFRAGGAHPAVAVDPGFGEIGQGEWEGLLHAEVAARWPSELAAWRREPAHSHAPGGEPLLAAAARVRDAVDRLLGVLADASPGAGDRDDDGRSGPPAAPLPPSPVPGYPDSGSTGHRAGEAWGLVVAHDGIFRLVLLGLLGLPYERFWSFPFSLCAISVVAVDGGVGTLRAHNVSDHLAPLTGETIAAEEARGERRGAL